MEFITIKDEIINEFPQASILDIDIFLNWVTAAILAAKVPASLLRPIWVILIAKTGTGKTELLRMLCDKLDKRTNPDGILVSTSAITISKKGGSVTRQSAESKLIHGDMNQSFAMKYNNMCHIGYEASSYFPGLKSVSREEFYATERDEYDGKLSRDGTFASTYETGIRTNKVICSTPDILYDDMVFSERGQRFVGIQLGFANQRALKEKRMNSSGEFSTVFVPYMSQKYTNFIMTMHQNMSGFRFNLSMNELLGEEYSARFSVACEVAGLLRATLPKEYRSATAGRIEPSDVGRIIESVKTMIVMVWNCNGGYLLDRDKEVALQSIINSIPQERMQLARLLCQYKGITVKGAMYHQTFNYSPAHLEYMKTMLDSGKSVNFSPDGEVSRSGIYTARDVKKQVWDELEQKWVDSTHWGDLVTMYEVHPEFRNMMLKIVPELEQAYEDVYYYSNIHENINKETLEMIDHVVDNIEILDSLF